MARVLIVEDDRPFADALAFAFRLEGYEVLEAATADEGIRIGLAHYPDIIIADWMLRSDLHGGEVCRQILRRLPAGQGDHHHGLFGRCFPSCSILWMHHGGGREAISHRRDHQGGQSGVVRHRGSQAVDISSLTSGNRIKIMARECGCQGPHISMAKSQEGSTMTTSTPTVYIVDDDPQVCESLSLMVRSAGLNADTYPSAEAFLDGYDGAPRSPRCMVLDVRMPGISGLGLQQMLAARGEDMSIIMISGCADIPMAVQAMSAGALDFLEKPFSRQTLLARIHSAIDRDAQRQRRSVHKSELMARLERLSARQREVLDLLVAGKHSKQIAGELGIGEKTVAKHRAGVLEKMQVDSVVGLVRLMADANLG